MPTHLTRTMREPCPLYIITLKQDFPECGLFRGDRLSVCPGGVELSRAVPDADLPDELRVGVIAARAGLKTRSSLPRPDGPPPPLRAASGEGQRIGAARLRLLP